MAMSVLGILSSSLFGTQSVQNPMLQAQQLGNNLKSGNLSAAKASFATLQQSAPQTSSTSSSQSSNPIAQAFTQLGKDLQSGNVPAAQQDYSQHKGTIISTGAAEADRMRSVRQWVN
jgi:hypothetical protein